MQVKVKKMFEDVQLPEYATPGSACFDIRAYMPEYSGENLSVAASIACNQSFAFGTGLQFEIPDNFVMLVFSRSGHGFKDNIRLANCVGVIDSDYRGELKVKLTNDGADKKFFKHGDRIAQGMIIPYEQVQFVLVDELSGTERGEAGFGSTGAA